MILNCLSKATEWSNLKNTSISRSVVTDYHDNRRDDTTLHANKILEFLIIVIYIVRLPSLDHRNGWTISVLQILLITQERSGLRE